MSDAALESLEELITTWLERGVKEGPEKREPEDKTPPDPGKLAWAMGHFRCAQELSAALAAARGGE